MAGGAATILHADLDAFYASVELTRRPDLRGRPLVVGGGVVLSATYEARRFGVHSAMPITEARRRCPRLVVIGGEFAEYAEASRRVFEVFDRFTPLVEPLSIDEAFLETAGVVRLFGPPAQIAAAIRRAVRAETGLPISIGIARTKFLAKVASRRAKPDGLLQVDPATELTFLHPLPVQALWGVGPETERRLARLGIATVGELAAVPTAALHRLVGTEIGAHLHALALNRDPRRVTARRRAGSVGAQSTFSRNAPDPAEHARVLLGLAERIGRRLRRKHLSGRRITVRVRFADFETISRSTTAPVPLSTTTGIYRIARRLTADAVAAASRGRGLRLLGISVGMLEREPPLQLALDLATAPDDPLELPGTTAGRRRARLDAAADAITARFGTGALGRAALLDDRRRSSPPKTAPPDGRSPDPDRYWG